MSTKIHRSNAERMGRRLGLMWRGYLRREQLQGRFELREVVFRYDEDAATLAWERTVAWFNRYLT